jgi:N-acetylmuramoyl-L-alanine amidase
VLAVGRRISELLAQEGVYCVLTRDRDEFVGLYERPAQANRLRADLFVSVHCNADAGSGQAQGTETWFCTDRSKALAAIMQSALVDTLGRPDRGVKRARFVVVREAEMPACLVELAFISSAQEHALLAQPSFRERAARAVVAGLRQYVEGTGLKPTMVGELGR